MPTRLAVNKEIIRDNSAQREEPVAKELRFDRVTKKMNKNHRRPIYGGEHEATKEEERQKKTQDKRRREAPEETNQAKGTDARETKAEEAGNPKTERQGGKRANERNTREA